MATIESTNSFINSTQQDSSSSAYAPDQQMGQKEFLLLLTTQLQNQDPTKPMDPTSFVTDLTQMNQLESTNQMTESIREMTNGFQSMQVMQGAALIGKSVQVSGDGFSHSAGEPTAFKITADEYLTDGKLVISDSTGIVKEITLGDIQKGEQGITWDGTDNDANARASGEYEITAYGTNESGDVVALGSIVPSKINSISVNEDGTIALTLKSGDVVSMDSVKEIGA